MLYVLYKPDGSIYQANKLFDPTGYDDLLREQGHETFVKYDAHYPVNPELFYVDVANEDLLARPDMEISVSKPTIKADGNDSVVFTNIPKDVTCAVHIWLQGERIGVYAEKLGEATEFEFAQTSPAIYHISFDKWPYRRFEVAIEVAAS
ncbi:MULTISPECIES: hypothetical protein [unclassified Bradyrhizobium]